MSATEWKFVPVEPTMEMVAALGFDGDVDVTIGHGAISAEIIAAYTAMLDAAPVPPSVESLLENWTPSDQKAFTKFRDEHFPGEMSSYAIQSLGSAWKDGQANAAPQPAAHLTIPGALEWDGDNGTHGADGESRAHGESAYTAVDMTTAAADGFRDGLAAFSADGKRNVLAEVFFQKGDDPFICAVRGRICVEQLEAAQRDFRENLPDELEQGDGIYTFDFFYEKGQYDEFGRCEIAPGWGFDFVSFAAFEAADEPVDTAKCESCGDWGHIETEDSAHDCPECGPSVIERAVEAGVMNPPAEKDPFAAVAELPYVPLSAAEVEAFMSMGDGNKAKQKTCIECDQPYCHGVCVERGDQDYDRDQAAKGGEDE
jgi:predicted RNA-binding Zn-ribbon protein involved in translation (DUF1610 family)